MDVESCRLALSSFQTNAQSKIQLDRNTLLATKESLEGRMSELEQQVNYAVMRAPISGRIDESERINVGDYILAGQEIVKIVPQSSSSLKAELLVAPGDIARIQTGMKLSLRFTALPPSEFGDVKGTISLLPADVTLGLGNVPYFAVEINLDTAYLMSRNGEDPGIMAGHRGVRKGALERHDEPQADGGHGSLS